MVGRPPCARGVLWNTPCAEKHRRPAELVATLLWGWTSRNTDAIHPAVPTRPKGNQKRNTQRSCLLCSQPLVPESTPSESILRQNIFPRIRCRGRRKFFLRQRVVIDDLWKPPELRLVSPGRAQSLNVGGGY